MLRSSAHPYAVPSRENLDEHLTVRSIRRSDKGETDVRYVRAFPLGHEAVAMAEEGAELLAALQSLLNGKGLSVLAGSRPVETPACYLNRVCFLRPGAGPIIHDKPCLTPLTHGDQGGQLREG